MSNKVYIVTPQWGYGSDDCIIVAPNEAKAIEMYLAQTSNKNQKPECREVSTNQARIVYTREDNL